jgi:hypothetical protein
MKIKGLCKAARFFEVAEFSGITVAQDVLIIRKHSDSPHLCMNYQKR